MGWARTLAADGAEPALGLTLPTSGSGRNDGSKGLLRVGDIRRSLAILAAFAFTRSTGSGPFSRLHDLTAGAEFNHVDSAVAAGDQVTAGQQNHLAWSGETEQTFR